MATGEKVYYGVATPSDSDVFDYTVFHRIKDVVSERHTSTTEHFRVAVVRECLIEDGDLDKIVAAVLTVPKVKRSDVDVEYDYARRSNGIVLESASVIFTIPRKGR